MSIKWQIEKRNIDDLKGYEKNPRKFTDKGLKDLKKSLENCGDANIITINKDNTVLGGHARLTVMKQLGYKEVDVKVPERLLNDKECQEIVIRLNANTAGEWDFEKLETDFDTEELEDWGLDVDFAIEEEEKEVVEDEVPETVETRCKLGDIWQLGEHRLCCGDSTKVEDVEKLMNGEKADMVFTDPPYGMKKEKDGVLNDNLNFDDLLEFNKKWIPLTFNNTKENGSWYCWGIDEPLMDIYAEILKPMQKENKVTFRNLLVWDKKDAGAGGVSFMGKDGLRSYPIGSEKCLFAMCGVQGFNNNQDNYFDGWETVRKYLVGEAEKVGLTPQKLKEICGVGMWSHWFSKSQFAFITEEHYKQLQNYYKKDAFKKEYDAFKKEYDELKKEYYSTRAYFDNTHDKMRDVWDFGRISHEEKMEAGGHATPKPIALCSRAIKSSSRENETVLDVFGGSGSTLIACEQLNRKCYTMELDEKYCDVIIQRWENLTGKKAVKID